MKKIMFNDKYGLTEAVLNGRKTQTRRIINPQPEVSERLGMVWKGYAYGITSPYGSPNFLKDVYRNFLSGTNYQQNRRHKAGEVVAVAQSYKDAGYNPDKPLQDADGVGFYREAKLARGWNNKMFVQSALMPHRLRITNVRVERLQDISDEDCNAEGIYKDDGKTHFNGYAFQITRDQYGNMLSKQWYSTPREAYAALIDRISGKGTWESNPYVFVYDFELVK